MSQFATNSYSFSSRQQRMWRRNQNTVRFTGSASKLGPVSHTVLVAVMLAILGMIYLTQVTKTGTYGYQLNDLETKKTELLSKKKDLEVENARLQALEKIQQSSVAKALDKPVSVEYAQN